MDGIDLWIVDLDAVSGLREGFAESLSADEIARAERFAFPHLREDFVACRGSLRTILAQYTGIAPRDLSFIYSAAGKPSLCGVSDLHFNLSHSGRMMACAVTGLTAVGVDIERIRPVPELTSIAGRYFSSAESETLLQLPEEERTAAFFRCWTRKEAFIKATGEGLSRGLGSFAVSLRADEAARLLWIDDPAENRDSWDMHSFIPAPGYSGAVAVKANRTQIKLKKLAQ